MGRKNLKDHEPLMRNGWTARPVLWRPEFIQGKGKSEYMADARAILISPGFGQTIPDA
jgi:hypothetical protein